MIKVNKHTQKSEATKQKLLKAVVKEKGVGELKIVNVSKIAGVDKKLIYFHFGSFDGLLNEYLRSKDFRLTNDEIPKRSTN